VLPTKKHIFGGSAMLRLRTVCLAAVALAAGGFFVGRMLVAQDAAGKARRGGPRAGGYGVEKLTLLKAKEVQTDLALTDDQKTTLEKFGEEMRAQVSAQVDGLKDLSQEDRRAKMAEIRSKLDDRAKEVQTKLDEVLNTQQRDRLAQIGLQARGLRMFAQKEVEDGLQLTDDQKEKLKDLRDKIGSERRDARGPGGPGGPGAGGPGPGGPGAGGPGAGGPLSDEAREKMKKLAAESMDKAKEILTAEQREKLDNMLGKKLDIDLSQLGGGNGFGGRGRRGRNGAGGPADKSADKSADKPADKAADKAADKTDAAAPAK
jgi:Spy/CpxP family protein refolding chaperone